MMKKRIVLCAGLCAALALTGCKSSESAYKKMYERAQAQEQAKTETEAEAVSDTHLKGNSFGIIFDCQLVIIPSGIQISPIIIEIGVLRF